MALFAAALVIPTLALIVLLFWHSAEAEQARVEQEVRDVAKAIAVALDRNLIARQSMLAALSTAPSLQAEDYAAFHRQAGELADAEGLDFVLRDPDGQLLIDTHVSWGEPLPRNALDIDRQVVETRRAAVSNLFICATSRQPCFAVVAPVLRDGQVVALLSAVTPSERAVQILRDGLPAALCAGSFADRNGILVARTRDHDAWVGRPITDQLRRAAVHPSGTWNGPSHEGNPLRGAYARSSESGWLVAVGVDRGRLMAPLHRMLWVTGTAAVVLAGLSALLAAVFGRRINRPVLALADAAAALGRTGAVRRLHSGIAEVDSVNSALVDAAARLGERDRSLRESEQRLQIALDAASLGTLELRQSEALARSQAD
ncbi:MAG: cache domain-containing protein [Allosphingosinicella sp.]